MFINVIILLIGFVGMEFIAQLMHRYVMHGFLWSLHQSHHQKGRGFFEKNDLYFLIFASPSILLIILGIKAGFDWRLYLGVGIALYGFTYLFIHDILIHRRIKILIKYEGSYIKAMRKAHKAHHSAVNKNAAESYGLLWIHKKYFEQKQIPTKFRGQNVIF